MSLEKIMVADDDQNICELLRLYLEKEQYTVVIANDGNEAIAKSTRKTRSDPAGYYDARS